MTRIVSVLLLLVVALGAGSELAWAVEADEVRVETNRLDLPPTHEIEDVEGSDEVVFFASSSHVFGSPLPVRAGERRLESALDTPPTQPPRG